MKSFHDIFGSAAWEKTTKRFGGRDIDEFSPMTLVQFRSCIGRLPTRMDARRLGLSSRRSFSEVTTELKPKAAPRTTVGSRLRSFIGGFTVAGTMSGYALYYKVQWANEELAAMVRETAARQAQIERRLSQLESR